MQKGLFMSNIRIEISIPEITYSFYEELAKGYYDSAEEYIEALVTRHAILQFTITNNGIVKDTELYEP